jgi:hypothetical protein
MLLHKYCVKFNSALIQHPFLRLIKCHSQQKSGIVTFEVIVRYHDIESTLWFTFICLKSFITKTSSFFMWIAVSVYVYVCAHACALA